MEFSVAEQCLAHAISSNVTRSYLRTSMLERRRPVLASWAAFCCGKTGDNVVDLRRAGRDPSREFSEDMEAPRRGRSARG